VYLRRPCSAYGRGGVWCGGLSGTARIRLRSLALPAACAFLGALVALVVWLSAPPSGDAPSHLFQTWLFSNSGFELWNNYWYAGRYEFVTYSVFYYPLAAQVGQLAVLVPAAALLCGCFARAAQVEWGRRAVRGPVIAFAITAPFVMLVGGLYPFLVATACGALALVLLQRGWRVAFTVAVFATLAFSPLGFVVLAGLLAGVALGQRQPLTTLRSHRYAFAAVLGVFVAGVFMQRAFPTQSWYPYDLTDGAIVLGFSLAGLYITGASPRARSLRMLFVVYLSLNLVAFLLQSPIGSNATRLFAIAGAPMLWLAANISRRRSRLVVVPLLAVAMALQVGPWVRDAYSAWNNPAADAAYWEPALEFLRGHQGAEYRVEAVATWGHWDAYYLARRRVPLARGWYRQDDFPQNQALYQGDTLTASRYQAWLRSLGVRYVLLPDTALDYSSGDEAKLLRSGLSGLVIAGRTKHWTFYELPNATPILTGPVGVHAKVVALDAEQVWLYFDQPGRFLLRVRYSPYWRPTAGEACLASAPNGMTEVTVKRAGFLRLAIQPGVDALADAVSKADASRC
jgi:hypothetical protein